MSDLRTVAQWLIDTGYISDWVPEVHPPIGLWNAFVDIVHEDADGTWHGRELSREEVDSWLRDESGRGDFDGTC